MASTIITKNSSTASAIPAVGDLTKGELAVNVTDKKVYTKDNSAAIVKIVGSLGNQEANAVAITGGSISGITDLAVADGGTGASTATAALNNLLPSQTSNANKYLQTDGTNATWDAISISTGDITGTLPVANGGTGVTSSTGTGNVVLSNSPTLVTPSLGTPASGVATNLTGLPLTTGVTGTLPVANGGTGITSLGTGVATFLGTPSSANLASAVSDETGSGALVFANSPTLVTPALGTPSSGTLTNATGLPISTGVSGLGTGVATFLGTPSSANLRSALTDETGTGSAVFATSPALVTPDLGTPSAATLTNATGLPISTGVSGLGTGVATFLATPSSANLRSALTDETGTGSAVFATSPTLVTPVLGTPTSATLTNATGLPLTTGVTGTLPTANGGTNLSAFTSGGVVYASSSSALATGSALNFDGSNLGVVSTGNSLASNIASRNTTSGTGAGSQILVGNDLESDLLVIRALSSTYTTSGVNVASGALIRAGAVGGLTLAATDASGSIKFAAGGTTEGLRLTSSSLYTASGINVGIGTSNPQRKIDAQSTTADYQLRLGYNSSFYYDIGRVNSNGYLGFYGSQTGATGFTFGGVDGTWATISSTGNLGLGVAPSAWSSDFKSMDYANGMFVGNFPATATAFFGLNAYYDSGWKYKTSTNASYYEQYLGQHQWHTAPSGTAGNAISFTQAMTLDASGNLGVGLTNLTDYGKFTVRVTGTATPTTGPNVGPNSINLAIGSSNTDVTGGIFGWHTAGPGIGSGIGFSRENGADWGTQVRFYTHPNATSNINDITERARIDASGNLLVGTTSQFLNEKLSVVTGNTVGLGVKTTGGASNSPIVAWNATDSGDGFFAAFCTETSLTVRGSITYNRAGGLTAYNVTSDYRAKDISGPVTGSGALIDSIPVYMGKMKDATQERPMFIAHETPSYAHTGVKDAVDADGNPVYQQMDASALIPVMWAEIQSLRQRLSAANL